MNLLTNIKIKGEIFLEYAFLSYDLSFKNNADTPLSAEYRFSVPQGAVVSDMKIIKPNGTIIKSAIVSLTHAAALWNSSNCAILRRLDDTTYRLNLDSIANGTCRVIIHIYAPLLRSGERRILAFPQIKGKHSVDAEIFVRAADFDMVSATNNAIKTQKQDGILINADGDLTISIKDKRTYNSAIAVQGSNGGEMLCRVYADIGVERSFGDEKNFQSLYSQSVGNDLRVVPCENRENIYLAHIISSTQDNITLYLKYNGDIPPTEFDVDYMGEKLHIKLDKAEIYKSFSPIRLVCADALYNNLCKRLEVCTPNEVQAIKAEMERVGIKYSALNAETAIAAVVQNGMPTAIRVVFCESGTGDIDTLKESDIFMSSREEMESFDLCLKIIIKSMHANGGIFANGELNQDEQKKQTLVCLLVLSSAGLLDEYKDFVQKAIDFLNGYTYNDIYYTKDKKEAKQILSGVFARKNIVLPENPDLLSAVRFIYGRG